MESTVGDVTRKIEGGDRHRDARIYKARCSGCSLRKLALEYKTTFDGIRAACQRHMEAHPECLPNEPPRLGNRAGKSGGSGHMKILAEIKRQFPDLQTEGFKQSIIASLGCTNTTTRAVCVRGCCEESPGDEANAVRELSVVPDGFRLSANKGRWTELNDDVIVLEIYEVEVESKMTKNKMEQYLNLWWTLDSTGTHEMVLYIVNRFGHISVLGLLEYDLAQMKEMAPHV